VSTPPVPRYEEIARYLRSLVADARPGDRMPSDAELCERFSVSRMTARHAVEVLANENLIVRRRGKGTFVASRRVPRLLGSPLSFTESMRRRGLTATSQVLVRAFEPPSAEDIDALGIDPGDTVLVLERLRLANGTPMAIERAVVHPEVASRLPDDASMRSLHAAFEQLGHIPTRALATVSARTVTAREARYLELPRNGVVLCERRIIENQHGLPLEHTETRYAAARYEFDAVLHREATDVLE
jgi:GntR family transcriptional regulator